MVFLEIRVSEWGIPCQYSLSLRLLYFASSVAVFVDFSSMHDILVIIKSWGILYQVTCLL